MLLFQYLPETSYFIPEFWLEISVVVIFVSLVPKRRHISKSSIRYVLSIATTLESHAHCSRYLVRLSAGNKLTLFAPDSRGRWHSILIGFNVAADINSNMSWKNGEVLLNTFCPLQILCMLQRVSGQTVGSKQTHFFDARQSGEITLQSDRFQCSRWHKQ